MGWYQQAAACLVTAGLLFGCAFDARAQPATAANFAALEGTWCSEAHEDYRPGKPVIEIRQIRSVQAVVDPQTGTTKQVIVQLRSAVVSAVTGIAEVVGGWIEFRFEARDDHLVDPGVQVTLMLPAQRDALIYQYGEGKPYRYVRCGPGTAPLDEGRPLPPGVSVALREPVSTPSGAPRGASPPPSGGNAAGTAELDGNVHVNRSHCLTLRKTRDGYLGLQNRCSMPVNYTYCVVNPTTRQARFFVCRTMTGTQIGRGSGAVGPKQTGYLGLPSNERGTVVWFACEQPSVPALTGASPSVGRCQ